MINRYDGFGNKLNYEVKERESGKVIQYCSSNKSAVLTMKIHEVQTGKKCIVNCLFD